MGDNSGNKKQIGQSLDSILLSNTLIKSNDIDVESIMADINNKLVQNRINKFVDDNEIKFIDNSLGTKVNLFDIDLSILNYNKDINNYNYSITSHRKVLGPVIVKGRQMVNDEVRRYIDPIIEKQNNFNYEIIRILMAINGHISTLKSSDICERLNKLESGHFEDRISSFESSDLMGRIQILEEKMCNINEPEMTNWSKFYNKNITEDDLKGIIEHHMEFVELIKHFSCMSAGDNVPKLIEIGLGTASFSIYFSRYAYSCIGIDNDPLIVKRAIETSKKLGGFAKFVMIDAFDLDIFKEEQFDIAFSQGTMEHFDNNSLIELLSKQLTIAKYVAFSVPSVHWPYREYGNERKMTVEEWETILKDAGFRILHLDYYKEKLHIGCIITKERS
ncbi:hypothetical protein CUJ83_13985 [Methanocella sp. CWC-04]|uniref:Methyltransferase type 11 domain-containing protein n=1 Tax=Methanooceanicella nereidis TaxID=2052831 RepID=A0AAP2REX8_9EURY|nr:class I SAM-dependent methyltransferase [Methanocella sp. CWC-04]MCD1296109.1 hypothetical protein [Methanocella sp. CWC-04]